jgi:hypothetical protein
MAEFSGLRAGNMVNGCGGQRHKLRALPPQAINPMWIARVPSGGIYNAR